MDKKKWILVIVAALVVAAIVGGLVGAVVAQPGPMGVQVNNVFIIDASGKPALLVRGWVIFNTSPLLEPTPALPPAPAK